MFQIKFCNNQRSRLNFLFQMRKISHATDNLNQVAISFIIFYFINEMNLAAEASEPVTPKVAPRPLPKGTDQPESEADPEPVGDRTPPSHAAVQPLTSPQEGVTPWPPINLMDRPPLLAGIADPVDFLGRIFPRMKRPVLQLMLSGCEGDLMRTIDRVISSGERPEPLLPPGGLLSNSFFTPPPPPPPPPPHVVPISSEAEGLRQPEASHYSPMNPSPFPGVHFPSPIAPGPDSMSLGARYPLLPPTQPFPRGLPLSFPYPSFLPAMPVSLPYSGSFPVSGPPPNTKS